MILKVLIVVMVAAFLAACSPAVGTETAAGPESVTAESAPALERITPESSELEQSGGEQAETPAAYPDAGVASGYPEQGVIAPSGEAYPGEETPASGVVGGQIAPAPGKPDLTRMPQAGLFLEAAVMDASERSGVAQEAVEVVSVEPMTWPNTSLGCPEEGLAYAEVITEGSLITLEVGGETFTYHTAGSGEYVLCEDGEPIATGIVPQR